MLIGKERSELYVGLMLIGKGEEGVNQESKCEGVLLRVNTRSTFLLMGSTLIWNF